MLELLALVVVHQQSHGYLMPGEKPRLDISRYKLPILGGQREIIMGPIPIETQYEGYFLNKAVAGPKGNADLPATAVNWVEFRVGYMSWSVGSYQYEGKEPAYLIQTDGTYKQVLRDKLYGDLNLVNRMKRSFWVSKEGKLLQENSLIEVANGTWSMQATFNRDGYDVYLRNPYTGETKRTVNVPFDTSMFDAMFKPMVVDGKTVLQEKEFYDVDPILGNPVKKSAKVGGRWNGFWFQHTPYEGYYVDLTDPTHTERVYMTDDADLFRVEEPDAHYLNIEQKPDHPKHSKH